MDPPRPNIRESQSNLPATVAFASIVSTELNSLCALSLHHARKWCYPNSITHTPFHPTQNTDMHDDEQSNQDRLQHDPVTTGSLPYAASTLLPPSPPTKCTTDPLASGLLSLPIEIRQRLYIEALSFTPASETLSVVLCQSVSVLGCAPPSLMAPKMPSSLCGSAPRPFQMQ